MGGRVGKPEQREIIVHVLYVAEATTIYMSYTVKHTIGRLRVNITSREKKATNVALLILNLCRYVVYRMCINIIAYIIMHVSVLLCASCVCRSSRGDQAQEEEASQAALSS